MRIFVKVFIYLHYLLNTKGVKIHGLGRIQKLLKREFVFKINGKKFLFSPGIEGSYDYLLIKKSNEPETEKLLSKIFIQLTESNFIDVGASVGEFVTFVSGFKNVKKIYAFEPRNKCAEIIRTNALLNEDERIIVIEKALSDKDEEIMFFYNKGGTSSGFFNTSNSVEKKKVNAVTLDSAINTQIKLPVMLIDVEGAEPMVLKGGSEFISRNKPLIIFEYNQTSKGHFNLNHIQEILGNDYFIYRIRGDSNLDTNFENSWNCIAIPAGSEFETILRNSIIQN